MPASPATTGEFNVNEWGQMDYYQCKPGYSFADAEVHKLFWCTRDGTWLPVGQTCIRMFHLHYYSCGHYYETILAEGKQKLGCFYDPS